MEDIQILPQLLGIIQNEVIGATFSIVFQGFCSENRRDFCVLKTEYYRRIV